MPTHKELLEQLTERLGLVSDSLDANTDSQCEPLVLDSSSLEASLEKNSRAGMRNAALGLVAAVLSIRQAQSDKLMEAIHGLNKRTGLMNAIDALGKKYGRLTYDFIIDRAYVENTDREERQNILNWLILQTDILTEHRDGDTVYYEIDWDNPAAVEWADKIEALRESLSA